MRASASSQNPSVPEQLDTDPITGLTYYRMPDGRVIGLGGYRGGDKLTPEQVETLDRMARAFGQVNESDQS